MARSTREIEIKLPFDSPRQALESLLQLGAENVGPRLFEDNLVFDAAGEPLESSGRLLRLRVVERDATVTFKAPVPGEHRHKVRIEHETHVEDADAMRQVFEGLGYTVVYRYQKFRTVLEIEGVEAMVDETPIGCWVELEGEPEAIDRLAARLGFSPDRYVRSTYRELHVRAAAASGTPVEDLVFDPSAR